MSDAVEISSMELTRTSYTSTPVCLDPMLICSPATPCFIVLYTLKVLACVTNGTLAVATLKHHIVSGGECIKSVQLTSTSSGLCKMTMYSMLIVYTLLAILTQEVWELIIDMIETKSLHFDGHTMATLDKVTVFVRIMVPYVIAALCCVT